MRRSEELFRRGTLSEEECDEEVDRFKALGFTVFDLETSESWEDILKWADEEFQKLGYEIEELGKYPVACYRVVRK